MRVNDLYEVIAVIPTISGYAASKPNVVRLIKTFPSWLKN